MNFSLRQHWPIYSAFTGGVALALFICFFLDIQSFSVDTTGGINVTTREQNDAEFIASAWEDADRRAILISLLGTRGVYQAEDPDVVDAIIDLCDPIPREPLEEHLALAQECAEKPVPSRLRNLARQGDPPFHPAGRMVRIGVPDDEPPVGTANACQNGEWYRRRIELANRLDGRTVIVFASGHYGRGVCGVGTADLQLNAEDALSILDPPLDTFETAVATIVN